ncbi:MAG: hypothetical protein ACK56I_05640, partial [bacterium]
SDLDVHRRRGDDRVHPLERLDLVAVVGEHGALSRTVVVREQAVDLHRDDVGAPAHAAGAVGGQAARGDARHVGAVVGQAARAGCGGAGAGAGGRAARAQRLRAVEAAGGGV